MTADAVAALDRELVGYERPQDHAFWARERDGALFTDEAGTVLGYGYAHPSGRVGPVAAVEPEYLPSFIGYLVRITDVLEGRQLVVPGPAIDRAVSRCWRPACASTARPRSTAHRGPGPASTATSP